MTFALRDYQADLVARTELSLARGQVPCVVSVTGSGKTVIASELARLARARGEGVLVACHRIEIMQQLAKSLYKHLGEMPQIITAASTTPLRDITVCMIPTLVRRQRWIDRLQGRTYILDECHHAIADSYMKLRERLNPGKFIGLTATPISPSGGGLSKAGFTELILGPEARTLMDNGALADYLLYGAPAEVNTDNLTIRAGDYVVSELEERVVEITGSVYRDWRRFNPEKKSTLCIGVSVKHAHELAAMFVQHGEKAVALDGTTPAQERSRVMDAFRAGEITILCCCSIVEEGTDLPEASCLQLIRPTQSIRLYRQLIGRVLRVKKDGSKAIIIDNSSSWRHLPLPDEHIPWSLTEKIKKVKAEDRQVSRDDDYIVAKRETVVEDHRPLVLVSAAASLDARRDQARRRLRKMIGLVNRGIIPQAALYNHMRDARYFTDDELLLLQDTLNLQDNWAETQGWLNV